MFFFNSFFTALTIYALKLLPFTNIKNYFLLDNGFKLYIIDSCNGLLGIVIWFWLLVIFNIKEIKCYLIGAIFLFVINLLRIAIVAFLTNINANYFELAHNVVGRIFYVVFFLLALLYVKRRCSY